MKSVPVDRAKFFNSASSQSIHLSGQTVCIKRSENSLVITHEEDAWKRFDRGISGLASVLGEFHRDQASSPDKRAVFP
jgi:hypothetical protein